MVSGVCAKVFEVEDTTLNDEKLFNEIWELVEKGEEVLVKYKGETYKAVDVEEWEPICLEDYVNLEEVSEDWEALEEAYWEALDEALRDIKESGECDELLYAPPSVSGVSYGATICLVHVGNTQKSRTE